MARNAGNEADSCDCRATASSSLGRGTRFTGAEGHGLGSTRCISLRTFTAPLPSAPSAERSWTTLRGRDFASPETADCRNFGNVVFIDLEDREPLLTGPTSTVRNRGTSSTWPHTCFDGVEDQPTSAFVRRRCRAKVQIGLAPSPKIRSRWVFSSSAMNLRRPCPRPGESSLL